MKVLSLVNLTDHQKERIEKIPGVELAITSPKEVSAKDLENVEVLYDWTNSLKTDILNSPSLNWVQVVRAGVDALPLRELSEKGITLTTGSGANAINIAEQTIAYMLMLMRNMNLTVLQQANKEWKDVEPYDEVYGKTVMIVGVGHIGSLIAQYAKALGMKTVGVRKSDQSDVNIDEMIPMSELKDGLKHANFVINALPDTSETNGLFNKELFEAMSKKAFYINIGRGKTTNMEDLVTALQERKIAGSALDVTTPEPLNTDSPLWEMKNVIITPHNAGMSVHYGERAFGIFKRNLKSYVENGEVVENVVDFKEGY